jgi:hypothetical protein
MHFHCPRSSVESGRETQNLGREAVEQILCGAVQSATLKQPMIAEAGEPPGENVLRNRQRRIDGNLLKDEAHAALRRLRHGFRRIGLAIKNHLA